MRIVLDASVAVAAQRPQEAAYAASRARLVRFLTGSDTVVVPSFFVVEVSGALSRLGFDAKGIRRLVDRLVAPPHEVVTVGPKSANAAMGDATDHGSAGWGQHTYVGSSPHAGMAHLSG